MQYRNEAINNSVLFTLQRMILQYTCIDFEANARNIKSISDL